MYDPTKKEIWIISSSGFWRDGSVNQTQYMIRANCTWEEAKGLSTTMAQLEQDEAEAIRKIKEEYRISRKLFHSSFS